VWWSAFIMRTTINLPDPLLVQARRRAAETGRTGFRTCSLPIRMVTDAYFAALALESGCEWVTTDRDYGRFPGLAWRHPLNVRR
jgi:uncharacterized protein